MSHPPAVRRRVAFTFNERDWNFQGCKVHFVTFPKISVMYVEDRKDLRTGKPDKSGAKMIVVLKWIAALLVAGFVWLVGVYTDEYFRPYKKIRSGFRKK